MSDITVTVRNLTGDFRKTTEVPRDMRLEDFKIAAQEMSGKSDDNTCKLMFEKTKKFVNEDDTFSSAAVESGTVFILTSNEQGG